MVCRIERAHTADSQQESDGKMDRKLNFLSQMPALKDLVLPACKVDQGSIEALAVLPKLRILDMSHTRKGSVDSLAPL